MNKEDAASPTVSTDAILLTAVIDAKEGRDVMMANIPNAFVQTENRSNQRWRKDHNESPRTTRGHA